MTDQRFSSPQAALVHYGVKGMSWGKRKNTIKRARGSRATLGDAAGEKEQVYLKARKAKGESASETRRAKVELQKAYDAEQENARVARTLTRGEQVAAVLLTGPVGAIAVGAKAVSDRDGRKVKPYNVDKLLKNVGPEDD